MTMSSISRRMPSISSARLQDDLRSAVVGRSSPSVSTSPRIRCSGVRSSCETPAENRLRASRKSASALSLLEHHHAPRAVSPAERLHVDG